MGAWPARITRADFVTPAEFRQGEQLSVSSTSERGAGRVGGVRLELVPTPRGTQLGRVYQQVPLRVLPPFSFTPEDPALVYLLNPTAGLLDGDAQLVEVEAAPGSRAVLTGQSATRVHPSLGRFATQQWRVVVHPGAV